jgi:hypothetical protein
MGEVKVIAPNAFSVVKPVVIGKDAGRFKLLAACLTSWPCTMLTKQSASVMNIKRIKWGVEGFGIAMDFQNIK